MHGVAEDLVGMAMTGPVISRMPYPAGQESTQEERGTPSQQGLGQRKVQRVSGTPVECGAPRGTGAAGVPLVGLAPRSTPSDRKHQDPEVIYADNLRSSRAAALQPASAGGRAAGLAELAGADNLHQRNRRVKYVEIR